MELPSQWYSMGAHRYRYEAPDIFFIENIGDVSGDEMEQMLALVQAFSRELGRPVCWVSNTRRVGAVDARAREIASKADMSECLLVSVPFGASWAVRTLSNLTIRAARMLVPERRSPPVLFCATEADARAICERMRQGRV